MTEEEIVSVISAGIDSYEDLFYHELEIQGGDEKFGVMAKQKLLWAMDYFRTVDVKLVPMDKLKWFTFVKFQKHVGKKFSPLFRIFCELQINFKDTEALLMDPNTEIKNFTGLHNKYYDTFTGVKDEVTISAETKDKLRKFCQFVHFKLRKNISRFHYRVPWPDYDEFKTVEDECGPHYSGAINRICMGLDNLVRLVFVGQVTSYFDLVRYKITFHQNQFDQIDHRFQRELYDLTCYLQEKEREGTQPGKLFLSPWLLYCEREFDQWKLRKNGAY